MEKFKRIVILIKTFLLIKQLVFIWKDILNEKKKELVINFQIFRFKHIFKSIQNKKYGGLPKKNWNRLRHIITFNC